MKSPNFPYYLTDYLGKYLPGQKNLSKHTISAYSTTFKLLFIFCEEIKGIKTDKLSFEIINHELIIDYLDWLESGRGCSVTTRNQRLVALHSFFRYVQKKVPEHLWEFQKILTIPNKKAPKTSLPYLTGEEMQILLNQPASFTAEGYRDRVLLIVLYDSAARVQELIDLKIKDVRLSNPPVLTVTGKGSKTRQIPIMEKTRKHLEEYISKIKYNAGIPKEEQHLFVNQKKQPLTRWGVSYIINKYVESAKNHPSFNCQFSITPHVFRHSKSMHMLQSGVNLIYIRDFLGHCDCSTTEIYARADTEMKRKAIEAAYNDVLPSIEAPSWNEDANLMAFLNSLILT
jgi:Site-specific recombinase XerD